jgi:hypothetical protein
MAGENQNDETQNDQDTGDDGDQVTFTPEQQEYLNKLIGQARVQGRESARQEFETQQAEDEGNFETLYQQAKDRLAELEPLEGKVETLETAVKSLLDDKLAALPEAARKAVDGLPASMSVQDKLKWIEDNGDLFNVAATGGTPSRSQRGTNIPPGEDALQRETRKVTRKF